MWNEDRRVRLHRFALATAFCALLQIVLGALVTSREAGLSVPDWPLAYGRLIPRLDGGIVYQLSHRAMALLVTVLTGVLAVGLWRTEERRWLRPLGFFALGVILLQILLGSMAVLLLLPPPVSTLHACVAEIFFCLVCAIALFTRTVDAPVYLETVPIRSVAAAVPVVAFTQVALGALARHKALGYIWHIADAALVTGVILWAVVRVVLHYPGQEPLRRAALSLLWLAFLQIFLGIAAYMSRLATATAVQPMPVMVTFTALHVAVGALLMAASVLFSIQVRRSLSSAIPARAL